MAAATPSARTMLLTTLLRPCAAHSYRKQLEPSAARHPLRHLSARAQTQEGNGANKQQPKKSAALSSAFERAAAYKKSLGKANSPPNPPAGSIEGKIAPSTANLTPDEGTRTPSPSSPDVRSNGQAQETVNLQDVSPGFNSLKSKQESEMASALAAKADARQAESGQADTSQGLEVEIITRDGIIRRKVTRPGEAFSKKSTKAPKRNTTVSSSDFMGLDFSEKKSSGKGARPAGLAVGLEAPPPSSLPMVEIITRDGKVQQGSKDGLYKPKVATWGMFERPANISETSELHGLAALQWAVVMDTSSRFQEAKAMYEKIAAHPNVIVRKKAKQLLYGFKAMDSLKVAASSTWDTSVYRKYFGAFSDGYNTLYKGSEDETQDGSIRPHDFVYLGLLLFPLVLFLLVVVLKGR